MKSSKNLGRERKRELNAEGKGSISLKMEASQENTNVSRGATDRRNHEWVEGDGTHRAGRGAEKSTMEGESTMGGSQLNEVSPCSFIFSGSWEADFLGSNGTGVVEGLGGEQGFSVVKGMEEVAY